ncbi:helix-turn-helix transcriptional regulator [Nakamurella flava]|uniref:Helix-turn-helix transcriptional regulator n=1 Tax=Nakamurella flava TaxID=2576308 RepID=A0A4U6QCN8_9ACTN|nr:LuxR family transcriptional regulator [Nakamurella flava]TKV57679.1 helix-turn-helix transcriptional regulator [Nakamurella flava]
MSRSVTATPFVARVGERADFAAAVARAAAGRPGLLLLAGDAGVGKTRLLTEAARDAESAGAGVVLGHCVDLFGVDDGDVGVPYLPFAEALTELRERPAGPTGGPSAVEAVLAARPALRRLLDLGSPEPDGADAPAHRLQLLDGIAAALAAAGRPGHPLLLVLEDLHWADPSSRDVLRFLAARLRGQHLLIAASYRTDDLHRRHPLRPMLAELLRRPGVRQIDLPAFSRDELSDFAAAVTGAPVPDAAVQRVLDRSEGNAYFAEELLADAPEPTGRPGPVELPGTLADVLRARVEALPEPVQRIARVAAVGGRRVRERLLVAAWSRAGAEQATGAAVEAALRDAVAHNLLVAEGRAEWAFRHALLAEAVYADLLPSEQVTLHRCYLQTLQAEPGLGSAAQIAHHAVRAHDLPAALAASAAAAREAAGLLAPAEELSRWETVLELWSAVPDAAELIGADLVEVQMAAATAASRAGEPRRAAALAGLALDQADPQRAARLTPIAAFHLIDADRGPEVITRARAALDTLDTQGPSVDRVRLLAAYARAAVNVDDDELARTVAARAIAEARDLDVADAEADALSSLAIVEAPDPQTAVDLLRRAVERARTAGEQFIELRAAHNLVSTLYYAGRLDEAREFGDEVVERTRQSGLLWAGYGISLLHFHELLRYVGGDLRPPELPTEWAPDSAVESLAVVGLYAAVARGDRDVIARARAVHADPQRDPFLALVSGGTLIDALTLAGEWAEAVDVATELLGYLRRSWNAYFLGGIWLGALALAALADQTDHDRRRSAGPDPARLRHGDDLLAEVERTADRGRPRGGQLGPEGRAWLHRARAEHARLHGSDDPDRWRTAAGEFDVGYRYEAARSRFRLAVALAGRGDRPAASAAATQALGEAREMGARPLTERILALGRQARLDLPGTARAVAVLTEREDEVLQLVARGMTNRQIGEQLFISPKTVSVHLSNVLGKLGVGGRTEAVAVALDRGLLGTSRPTGSGL